MNQQNSQRSIHSLSTVLATFHYLVLKGFQCFSIYVVAEVEKVITPHTSYEELVAQQSAEIEEIMRSEVQRFYDSWNKKLEDLRERNKKQRHDDDLEDDHHVTFGEEKQRLSDVEAEEINELTDDFNDINKQGRKSPFATSET